MIDCKWSEYGSWSECSRTCGTATRERQRTILQHSSNGGKDCSGQEKQTEDCKLPECCKFTIIVKVLLFCDANLYGVMLSSIIYQRLKRLF